MSVKKYVLAKEGTDIFDRSYRNRSPVLKVEDNTLWFNTLNFDLEGKEIEQWIKDNPEKLKHNQEDRSKPGTSEVFSVKENFKLFEVKLDEDEDFYITISKSDTEFFNRDFLIVNEIFEELKLMFNYIELTESHRNVYGLRIRDLIIKAATEVETHWKELMKLNGYSETRLNTKDYCKLLEFINFDLHLGLESYPHMGIFKPFENWNCNQPTQSLEWYSTYNSIKHDRTNTLSQATLDQAINAVGALYILATIRYGEILTARKIQLKIFNRKNGIKFSKWHLGSYSLSIPKKHIKYFEL